MFRPKKKLKPRIITPEFGGGLFKYKPPKPTVKFTPFGPSQRVKDGVTEYIKDHPEATQSEIAAVVGVNQSMVSQTIRLCDIDYDTKTRFRDCPDVDKLVDLSKSGLGYTRISKQMDSTPDRVRTWLKYYFVPKTTFFWIRKCWIPKDQLYHLYHNEELTLSEIAKVFDLNVVNVWRYMKEHDIQLHEPGNFKIRDKIKEMTAYQMEPEIGEIDSEGTLWFDEDESIDDFFI